MSLFDLAARVNDEPVLVLGERRLSRPELDAIASRVASRVGDAAVVSFVARPDARALSLSLSCISLGKAILPLHPRLTATELGAVRARFARALHLDDDEIDEATRRPPGARPEAVEDDERDLAILLSSGTSGEPKAVRLSRRAFAASARASASNLGFSSRDRWLLSMPFAHAGGLSILTRCLAAGRPVVVHPAFDPPRVVEAVEREGVTLLSVVPTMLAALLEEPRAERLRGLRAMLVGGAACPPSLLADARARGITALTTYGLTEACSQVTTQSLARADERTLLDSGVALPGVDVHVVGNDGRRVVGVEGRVRVAGPTLMSGYVGDAPHRGVFETGDLGVLDERGRLFVSGRADDVIVTGGENVSPLEVEHALLAIGGVREALVVGLPDARWGNVVGALLVIDEGRSLDDVLALARGRLAPHKLPRRALAVDSLPRGATGKPSRRAARERLVIAARAPST